MPGVPERWEIYTALGERVGNTNFIPFKVPLKPILCERLPEVERFTPSRLLNMVERLGLVIDLTNTRRYYNPEDFISSGVHYVKIFCQGRGSVPDLKTVSKFYDAVDHFLNGKKDGLIGVHCTHGLNRTGYLICRYMIENLGYSAENAIKEFNKARGHDIERFEYLRDLYKIETKHQNVTNGENAEAKDDVGGSKYDDRPMKSRKVIYFDHTRKPSTSSRGIYGQNYHQSNSLHYPTPLRYYQEEENTTEGKTRGMNNGWHSYHRRYHHGLHNETSSHLPRKYNYSFQTRYGDKSYENKRDYNRSTNLSQWCHVNRHKELN